MRYAVPLVILSLTLFLFFAPAMLSPQRGHRQFGWPQTALRVLAALPLLLSGVVLHFIRTAETASIIPPGFPDPRLLVYLSGLLEITGAIALFIPRLRRPAGVLVAIMLIAIFPANIYVAGSVVGGLPMPGVPVRTAMQAVYMLLVLVAAFGIPSRRSTT